MLLADTEAGNCIVDMEGVKGGSGNEGGGGHIPQIEDNTIYYVCKDNAKTVSPVVVAEPYMVILPPVGIAEPDTGLSQPSVEGVLFLSLGGY